MLKWFEKVQTEMDKIDLKKQDLIKNLDPIGGKEVVVGVLNDDLKKLLLLSVQYIDACCEAARPMKIDEFKEFMAKAHQNREISDTLRSMFWVAVADTFSDKITSHSLGLREGWTIVQLDSTGCSTEESFLDGILDRILGHSIVVMSGSDIPDFSEIFGGKRPH